MKKIIFVIVMMFLFPLGVLAEKTINAHLFYQEGCPHCELEKEFFDSYLLDNSDVKLFSYEIINNKENRQLFNDAQKIINKKTTGVPFLVIGNQGLIGFSNNEVTGKNIEIIINYYRENPYRDLIGEEIGIVPVNNEIVLANIDILSGKMNIPILGEIDPKSYSLPILAIVIGFVDGFNPCAMWILIFLITMLFGMKDRKKMWILGITFLVISSLTYFIFMVAWLNLAKLVTQINLIRMIIALVAIIFGSINLKKYFTKKDDGCEVVSDNKRKKIMDRIKEIVSSKSFTLSLIGISLLAISVNVIELLCSLGLPVIYTQVLAMNELSNSQYYLYIVLYVSFFLLDDLIIFFLAMKSLKLKAISTRYTKYSHLIGGVIMLIIGLLMIFKPEWLMFNF